MAAPVNPQNLEKLLKEYFGFDTFRPLQREIVSDVLAGRDVFALLPAGGGKSLCFQLPALAGSGLTLVVSPLIALMKDQVDSMTAMGIAATSLNSSISTTEADQRLDGLRNGSYKLLYAAPERLMQAQFLAQLSTWNVRLIAIDEAHCISEWGHDFRPEYRQLARVREQFADVPLLALTATATARVRTDIVRQLKLRDPGIYVASFNRPNLSYTVMEKFKPAQQTIQYVKARPRESGIVYCQSRKSTESVAESLVEAGIRARAYHAGMPSHDRGRVQDSFLRDEMQVICATIAFGMGINKPNVRFVIHYDLPKNIEGYYQETGRAGRDSIPSDCLLLYSAGDVVKLHRFLDEKPEAERVIGRQQIDEMVQYAESPECRRRVLLKYFNESYVSENCRNCDNCINPKVQSDGTLEAQKFLSCVYRVHERNGFGFGMSHYADILRGAESEKLREWGHATLSTYGIGKDLPRSSWVALGRELVRLGYLRQIVERFNMVELTPKGRAVLSSREAILLNTRLKREETKAISHGPFDQSLHELRTSRSTRAPKLDNQPFDQDLFERLRTWRKKIADERRVPAYIILSDVSLRQMARDLPRTLTDLALISGIGRVKLEDFGGALLAEIAAFLSEEQKPGLSSATEESF